jgi:hypothetical protein
MPVPGHSLAQESQYRATEFLEAGMAFVGLLSNGRAASRRPASGRTRLRQTSRLPLCLLCGCTDQESLDVLQRRSPSYAPDVSSALRQYVGHERRATFSTLGLRLIGNAPYTRSVVTAPTTTRWPTQSPSSGNAHTSDAMYRAAARIWSSR